MKRILSPLFLVLVLLAGGAALFYAQRPGRASATPMAAFSFLPADTLLLAAIPDPAQSASNWKTTDLYKIWLEPDVQAFVAKPLALIPPDQQLDKTLAQLAKVDPKSLFVALTALDDQSNTPHVLVGFQFKGSSGDIDQLLAPAKDMVRQRFPAGKGDLISYQGHSIETFDTGEGTTLASVYLGDWYLLAGDVALLKATIDRVDHRAPVAAQPTLDKDANFQAVCAKLPAGYETLLYGRVQPFLTRIFALAAASGQPVDEEARIELRKGLAFGATTKIDGGKLRDTVYYLSPGLKQDRAHLQMASLSLSSADTLAYAAGVFQIPPKIDVPAAPANANPMLSGPFAMLGMFGQQLQEKGITLDAVRAALGTEGSFQLDWPAAHAQPTALWSVEAKDPAAAEKILTGLGSIPFGQSVWEVKHAGALNLHVLTIPGVDAFRPTLVVTGKSLILGLNIPSVKEAAARETGTAPNFSQSEGYKTAMTQVGKPNVSFAYLDCKTLFERIYGVAKPAALLGAAFLYPQASDYVDLSKLPPTEAISNHLSPTVMSAMLDPQGQLVESVGSVTIFEAGATLVSGSLAAAMPMLQSHLGGLMSNFGAPPAAPALPGPSVSPSAQPGGDH